MKTSFVNALLAAALVLATSLVSCSLPGTGVTVVVSNASGVDITRLLIKFTGGSKEAKDLEPGKSFKTKVKPGGSSDLVVEFADSSGKQHSAKLDVYIEPNYKGTIHVTLEPNGKVTWNNRTTPL